MSRIALVSSEPIRPRMAGIGIRYFELARRLTERGIEIVLVSPAEPAETAALPLPGVEVRRFERGRLAEVLEGCDAAVAQGQLANDVLLELPQLPVAIDLYDPWLVENLSYAATLGLDPYRNDHATWVLQMSRGGITLSGGEPMVQREFMMEIFRRSKQLGLHTCVDTSGRLGDRLTDDDLMQIDLNILDIKSGDPDIYKTVTGQPLAPTVEYARRLSALRRPMWVRYVLVPGLTDQFDNVEKVADVCAGLQSLERVEILRFHQMGRDKWHKLGLIYPLQNTEPPDAELTEAEVVGATQKIAARSGLDASFTGRSAAPSARSTPPMAPLSR